MNPEFTRCVEKGKIVTFAKGPSIVSKELDSANDDLIASKDSLARGNYKWATIQAYYSMFHMARTLIYAKKYREKSHYCLVVALEHLYVERGVLEKGLVESLVIGKEMRESADYRSSFSKERLIFNGFRKPLWASIDPEMIARVISHLIENALKFSLRARR